MNKKEKTQFAKTKMEICDLLKSKGYSKQTLKGIIETDNYFKLSFYIQRKALKNADMIHEMFNLEIARKKKKQSVNKQNQGYFDKTISSIRTISTPMGNKK